MFTPACLPEDKQTYTGQIGTLSGLGLLNLNDTDLPAILQEVDMPIISLEDCRASYVQYDIPIEGGNLCAGDGLGIRDACQGDSGAPFVVLNSNNQYEVVGGNSFGIGCATEGAYAVYADYSFFRADFIDKTIQENGGATFCAA